jgi:hypothetical protein
VSLYGALSVLPPVSGHCVESTATVIGCPGLSVTNAVTTEPSSRLSSSGEARPPLLT